MCSIHHVFTHVLPLTQNAGTGEKERTNQRLNELMLLSSVVVVSLFINQASIILCCVLILVPNTPQLFALTIKAKLRLNKLICTTYNASVSTRKLYYVLIINAQIRDKSYI